MGKQVWAVMCRGKPPIWWCSTVENARMEWSTLVNYWVDVAGEYVGAGSPMTMVLSHLETIHPRSASADDGSWCLV